MSAHSSRIGIFGGTFDPIHLGHLILAETAFEQLKLDKLIFVPAKISPYKTDLPPAASAEHRMMMIQLAIAGREKWRLDSREIVREGPSFTIDTVRELQQEHEGSTFFLFIGEDQLQGLSGWKESEVLNQLVSFVVFSRTHLPSMPTETLNDALAQGLPSALLKAGASIKNTNYQKKFSITPIHLNRFVDISSTDIRERLAKNKNVDYLLSSTVHDYIKTHHLYKKNHA